MNGSDSEPDPLELRRRCAGTGGLLWGLALAACVASTQQAPPVSQGGPPPAWLDHPTVSKEELCAVGVSGPSYYPEDAVKNSKSQALTELARAVRVWITSGMEMTASGNAEQFQAQLLEKARLETDVVVQNTQIRGQWVNPGGYPTRGGQGTVYTLVCMPVSEATLKSK